MSQIKDTCPMRLGSLPVFHFIYEPYVCISQALCLYFKGSLPTVSELFARYAFVINGLLA